MRKALSILIVGVLPAVSFAAGVQGMEAHPATMSDHEMPAMHEAHASMAGKPGDPAKVDRTIDVTMDDSMRFSPDKVSVKAGETIRFFVRNGGRIQHEMVIGSMDELKEHAEMMKKMPGMQHAEANMVALKPGQRGGIVWQFDKVGTVDFACLVPGHMEAGMVGQVRVE